MVCPEPDSWDTSPASFTPPPTPPSPQPPSPGPTPNVFAPAARSLPSRIPQWDIQQINPNFAETSSFSFTSPPKDNPPLGPKPSQPYRTPFYQKPIFQNRAKMSGKAFDSNTGIERIQQILSTTLMSQNYATPFYHQQVCTQPTSRTYTFDDADEDGIVHIAIDAEQRLKDVMESCNSCETLGDKMSKIVHGQCVELFRIRCDEGENGERQIQGLELDLRRIKRPEVRQVISDSQSARMKLLEARMRGTDSSMPLAEEDNLWVEDDGEEDLGGIKLLQGIKSIADKYQDQEDEKRRRLGPDEEVSIKSGIKTGEEAKARESKNLEKKDGKFRALSLAAKAISLIQPRNRTSKQGSSIQMMPQPKKSKKNRKKKNKEKKEDDKAVEITRVLTPIQSITVYDAPTEGDLSLHNPQTAWAQRQGDELTITQRNEQLPSGPQNILSVNSGNVISGLMYGNRVDNEREKYRNIYSVQPPCEMPLERPRTNVFVLYSTEDEQPSQRHRPDIFAAPVNENVAPMPIMGSVKLIGPNDVIDSKEVVISGLQDTIGAQEGEDSEGRGTLVNQYNVPRTHEEMDNEVAVAMEVLKLEDGSASNLDLEATLDVLRNKERVSAEIKCLSEVQERARGQDREVDRLLAESNIPAIKYKATEPGQQFSLSWILDDLVEVGAQNAPSFEPKSPEQASYGQIASVLLYMPLEGCQQPTQQRKKEWLGSIASLSTSTTSTGGSESDPGEKLSPIGTPYPDGYVPLFKFAQETENPTMAEGAKTPLPNAPMSTLRYPPGFEPKANTDILPDGSLAPLAHLGASANPSTVKPLLERLRDEFDKLDISITREGGKKQKIKPGIVKKEWTGELQDVFETSYSLRRRHVGEVEGTIVEICDSDSDVSVLSTSDEIQPTLALVPDADTPAETHIDIKPEAFNVPTTDFTVESNMVIDIEAPKSTVVESLGRERGLGERSKTPKYSETGRQDIYAELPFPDTPFKSRTNFANADYTPKPTPAPKKEPKPEPPKITEEQQYQIAVAKLSQLPGFVQTITVKKDVAEKDIVEKDVAKKDAVEKDSVKEDSSPIVKNESEDESEEETEEEKTRRRALKGKAVDRDTWLGFDCRFFELPFELRSPSPHYPLKPTMLQDDIAFARAIHEALVEAEREFVIEKQQELAAQVMASETELSDVVGSEIEPQEASPEKTEPMESVTDASGGELQTANQSNSKQDSAVVKLAESTDNITLRDTTDLSPSAIDEDEDDPFGPAAERAQKEVKKAKLQSGIAKAEYVRPKGTIWTPQKIKSVKQRQSVHNRSQSTIPQSRFTSNMANISTSSMDSVVTVVPLTPEQLLQSPAEIYRAKQMAQMIEETESKLALVREAVAEGLKKYETPRRIKFDKMVRDAEKKIEAEKRKEVARRARQKPTPRQLPTPPKQHPQPDISSSSTTPRRIRPGMPNAEIDQTVENNEDRSDLINSSPSPAPRKQQMITKPQLGPLKPLKSILERRGPVETSTQESEEAKEAQKPADDLGTQTPTETQKTPNISKVEESSLELKDPKTPDPLNTIVDNLELSSIKSTPKSAPPLPPRPPYCSGRKAHLSLTIVRQYKAMINTLCPPAWQMLDMFFANLSRPDAEYRNWDELVALVFWNCERLTKKKMSDMPGDGILRVVVDYVTFMLGEMEKDKD
ncbi:uncharacterized protein DFL_000102 [Arthrobotrys flagrans]|uniref:Uncharacterized protein n=1 Tax=Arthrobotrys flagrans TaxID=97331 RepID=A0A437AE86_ARTFL|nr:hypothetical protein DFL_000102 [Arthrobotrys flagrans]